MSLPSIARSATALAMVAGLAVAMPATARPEPAGPQHARDPERVLVAFDPGAAADARRSAHAQQGGRVENSFEHLNLDVVRLPEGRTPEEAIARYERNPNVTYAQPNYVASLRSVPNDTLFKDQWGLHNTDQPVTGSFVNGVADADIDAPEGWDAAFGAGSFPSTGGVRVGILDTGIDRTHVDLLNKTVACAMANAIIGIVTEGSCSDDNLHGTHVAGTVAANTGNGVGVAGVAPNAPLAIFKALNAAGDGYYADVIAGIHWLHTKGGAKIISMSIGGPKDSALDAELTEAAAAGVLLIAAAGNDGDATANYPAFHRDVMSVGSIDQAGRRSSFSNCNSDVEIAAPGEDIWSTFPSNSYGVISGTSMATPHVSGVASMIMWKTGATAASTRTTLKNTAQGSGGCNSIGVVNLAAALGGGGTTTPPPPTATPGAITGVITDASSKAGISGATVSCGTAGTTTTATNGSYTLSNVAPSTYTCTASATGYRSKSGNVTVTDGTTSTLNLALRRA
ncbi:MAG TPA: S8 family serine peptidase [Mycobacteriales bacterium]|nr:S8 family serine peptidase [Mycobacteriales bacterium]